MFICLNCRGMITIFPEGTLALFSLIIFLSSSARNQLYSFGYNRFSLIIMYDQVHMV